MEKLFLLNPSVKISDIQDGINERLSKIRGVLNCLMFSLEFTQSDQELDHSSAYYALWAIEDFLDEICCLREKFGDAIP